MLRTDLIMNFLFLSLMDFEVMMHHFQKQTPTKHNYSHYLDCIDILFPN